MAATLRSTVATFAAAWCSSAWRSAHADRGWLGLGASDGGDSRAKPGSIRVVATGMTVACTPLTRLRNEVRPADAPQDAAHVPARLRVRRDAAVHHHGLLAGIVGGEHDGQVAVITVHQAAQMANAALDVLVRVERVRHLESSTPFQA